MEAAIAGATEPLATWDTAVSCLNWLKGPSEKDGSTVAAERGGGAREGAISTTRLVALVREYGLEGELAHLDWSGLHRRGFASPILVLLHNGNVAVVTGGGRGTVEEVAVWDPLDPDGERLFVLREVFERAWSGHAVVITRPPAARARRMALAVPLGVRLALGGIAAATAGILALLVPAPLGEGTSGLAPDEPIRVSFVAPQPMPSPTSPGAAREATPDRAAANDPAAPAAPASTSPKVPQPQSAADVSALLVRGDVLLGLGEVVSARSFYERAAAAGAWQGAVLLGETFDPAFLDRARLTGVRGDLPTALSWYRRARALGASEAEILKKTFQTP
jgi:hypothetical protein